MIDTLELRDYISFLCFIVSCSTSPCPIYVTYIKGCGKQPAQCRHTIVL